MLSEVNYMCELYGIISNKTISLNESLKLFYKHSDKNPRGWGLAYWNDESKITIFNEGKCGSDSELLQGILASPIESKFSIGHIRTASIGSMSDNNSHPFTKTDSSGRQWTLAHNGNMYVESQLSPYTEKQIGETDSERILLYLIDCINRKAEEKGSSLNGKERCEVVDSLVQELSPNNKLDLLIYDTDQFYVHINIRDSLYFASKDGYYLFATVPLENNFFWHKVPLNSLLVYSGIDQIYAGKDHGHEFINAALSKFDNFNV